MAHGAGRLARKTAALVGAAAIQAAKRGRSGAEEDNAAVEAAHSGAAAALHSASHHKTGRSSKRDANLRKRALRREENVRSESAKATENAAQAEHRKRNASSLSRKRSVNARLPRPGEKSRPSSQRADLPAR